RVLGLKSGGQEQLLSHRRIRRDDREAKSRNYAFRVGQRPAVEVMLHSAGRDDDLARAGAVLESAGKPDSDQAPWLEDVARVLGGQRRGDFAGTTDHYPGAAPLPHRES